METIFIGRSKALAACLTQEAQCAYQARSALVREAFEAHLAQRARERLLASSAHKAQQLDRMELEPLAGDFEAAEPEVLQQAKPLSAKHPDQR